MTHPISSWRKRAIIRILMLVARMLATSAEGVPSSTQDIALLGELTNLDTHLRVGTV